MSSSTSTDDLGDDASDDEGRRRVKNTNDSGRETEDEMRKRILEELEAERKEVERELRELKEKEDKAVSGGSFVSLSSPRLKTSRHVKRTETSHLRCSRLLVLYRGIDKNSAEGSER
jgi:hypothetical protein